MAVIGVTQWSLDGAGAETIYAAARLGFAAIHLDAGEVTGEQRLDDPALQAGYLRAAQETGVEIAAIAPGFLNDYGPTSPAGSPAARRCWDITRIALDAAAQMQVGLVFLPSFRAGEIRSQADLLRTAEFLSQACEYAAPASLMVATENTLGAAGNRQLLGAARQPNLCVLLDTQNVVQWGHDAAELIESVWPQLSRQVHVKDGQDGQMGNAVLGAGQSRFTETALKLQSLGFDGLLISENDYRGQQQANAARDIAVLSSLFDHHPSG